MDYKKLWIELQNFFKSTLKTGWGKNEIVKLMDERELEEARRIKPLTINLKGGSIYGSQEKRRR